MSYKEGYRVNNYKKPPDVMLCGHGFVTDPKKSQEAENMARFFKLFYKIKFLSPDTSRPTEKAKFEEMKIVYCKNDEEGINDAKKNVVGRINGVIISEEILK